MYVCTLVSQNTRSSEDNEWIILRFTAHFSLWVMTMCLKVQRKVFTVHI
jgi:hypothetical protein